MPRRAVLPGTPTGAWFSAWRTTGIGHPDARFGQAGRAAHDVGALDQGDALVERDAPRQGTASRRPAAAPNLKEKNSPSLGSLQADDAVAA
jgi:hypothetical protein